VTDRLPKIKVRWAEGQKWQEYVAKTLRRVGIQAEAESEPWDETRERVEEFAKYQADLIVGGRYPFEIKSKVVPFTSPTDYPFDTVLLDTVDGWDKKVIKPRGLLIVSQPTGAILGFGLKSHPKFGTVNIYDKYVEQHDYYYTLPKRLLLSFDEIVAGMRKMIENG
jgi:hypothetical protein